MTDVLVPLLTAATIALLGVSDDRVSPARRTTTAESALIANPSQRDAARVDEYACPPNPFGSNRSSPVKSWDLRVLPIRLCSAWDLAGGAVPHHA